MHKQLSAAETMAEGVTAECCLPRAPPASCRGSGEHEQHPPGLNSSLHLIWGVSLPVLLVICAFMAPGLEA